MSQSSTPLPSPDSDDPAELEIFEEALACPDPEFRRRLLAERCAGNEPMLRRIQEMLASSLRTRFGDLSRGLVPISSVDEADTVASKMIQEGRHRSLVRNPN